MALDTLPAESEDVIYKDSEEASQAELTEAAKKYVPKDVPGGHDNFAPQMSRFVHYVWGSLILDGWSCTKQDICVAIAELWNVSLRCRN